MSQYGYFDSWFWKRRKDVDPLIKSEARRRHGKREEYTVVVGGFEKPFVIILLAKGLVAVSYPDALLRQQLVYHFQEKEPNRLFLSMAVRRKYCPATPSVIARLEAGRKNPDQPWGQFLAEADRVLDGRTVVFKEDGSTIQRASRHGDARQLVQPGPVWDVSNHWEPYPEFGHYEHLLRRDRDIPWGPGVDGD